MIRVINFFCVAFMGLSILGLYHVSEKTRVTRIELSQVDRQLADEHTAMDVLETEWEHVAGPERIGRLAASKLGLDNTATMQLSSLELLPRRGDDDAPLNNTSLRAANAETPAQPQPIPTHSGM